MEYAGKALVIVENLQLFSIEEFGGNISGENKWLFFESSIYVF